MTAEPQITRVRHELKRRTLTVGRVERLAAEMVRVVLIGDQLHGFTSLGFDDHIKLFLTDETGAPALRDFTPRHFDAATGELWLDFFLHDAGPAAAWAARAAPGQQMQVGGPKGSAILSPQGIDLHVLIGDETALPAIGRCLAELPAGANARVFVEVATVDQWSGYPLPRGHDATWIAREPKASPAKSVITALGAAALPPDRAFYWVAMETQAARVVRRYLHEECGVNKRWIKAAGYWQLASPGSHQRIADDE